MTNLNNNKQISLLNKEVTTLATCWHLKRRDGLVFGFTDHDCDIRLGDITYWASSGFKASAIATSSSLAVDNLNIAGALQHEAISGNDLLARLYDYAEIEVFMADYQSLEPEKFAVRRGWLGEVHMSEQKFMVEVRGLTQALVAKVGEFYSAGCRASFGDFRCKVGQGNGLVIRDISVSEILDDDEVVSEKLKNIVDHCKIFDEAGNLILEVGDRRMFEKMVSYGRIRFSSGDNCGWEMKIKDYKNGMLRAGAPLPYQARVGDQFMVICGCDKSLEMCGGVYGNVVNFRGEPHIPNASRGLYSGYGGGGEFVL